MSTEAPNTTLVVVIPTKNRRALLERALGSVLSQSYKNYRVVVVNDGSTDGTREYLDSLHDQRIQIIHHEKSRGVNAARNAALRTLVEGEWAVQLDDDDMLLPDALDVITYAAREAPPTVSILCFNTVIQTKDKKFTGGRRFGEGEKWRDFSYEEIMRGERRLGDSRMVMKWTLFPQHLFFEDVNGFESEWILLLARDGIGIRYVSEETTWIDLAHEGEHLSAVAAKRDPASFTRVHARMFRDHKDFFAAHPSLAAASALGAIKLAVRAHDLPHAVQFAALYIRALCRSLVAPGLQEKHHTN